MKYIIMTLILSLICLFVYTHAHESVHQQIWESYGIESEIHIFRLHPKTITYDNVDNCDENCVLAHNLNEVFGYQIWAEIFTILICFIFFIFYLEIRKR